MHTGHGLAEVKPRQFPVQEVRRKVAVAHGHVERGVSKDLLQGEQVTARHDEV